jgi:diguanylate cyclase (GGDEF)-like protein
MILLDFTNKCDLELGSEISLRSEALFRLIDSMPHLACLVKNNSTMYTNMAICPSMADELAKYITNSDQEIVHESILNGFLFRIHTIPLDNVLKLIILVKTGDVSLSIDTLTKLPNRECFEPFLRKVLDKSRADNKIMSLLFLDLDGFKAINDTFGHDEGDVLLKIVADRISRSIRTNDLCFRLGGDEFAVIARDVKDRLHPCLIARRLIHAISEPVALSGSNSARVGCSIGIASYPFDAEDPDALLKNSDEAMYRAKKLGKNNYQLFGQ